MDEIGHIQVEKQLHVVRARAEVRNLARDLGFSTMDQARISLATSTLANILDLGSRCPGTILYGMNQEDGGGPSLYVICRTHRNADNAGKGLNTSQIKQLRKVLDELSVESLPPCDVQVTMVMIGQRRNL